MAEILSNHCCPIFSWILGKNKRTIRRKKTKQQNRGLTQGNKIGGPFFCPHTGCGKQFLRKEDIRKHKWTHKQEERFRCLYCGAAFSRADKLRLHSSKCDEVLLDDMGDIAASSDEELDR